MPEPVGPSYRRRQCKGKQGWTREEDSKIVQYVQLCGQKWAVIAALLPGRTDDAVRNRYLRLQKKKGVGLVVDSTTGQVTAVVPAPMTSDDLVDCESIKKGDMWTAEEDTLIVQAVVRFGQKCARPKHADVPPPFFGRRITFLAANFFGREHSSASSEHANHLAHWTCCHRGASACKK